jgi:thiamine biosynthesis protein ThiI
LKPDRAVEPIPENEKSGSESFDSVIVRFGGEIGIKKVWTRKIYERRLLRNMKSALMHNKVPYEKIVRKHGRLYVKTPMTADASLKLSRVFGISSLSPALETTSKLDDITAEGLSLMHSTLQKGNTFAVKCKRVGNHPYNSQEVCQEVGRRILAELPDLGLKVNLENPNVQLGIEIREESAFLHTAVVKGVGGLPLGTQPKAVCLLSGGIDSPVASWLAMKRGCPMVPIYFDNAPFTDESTTNRALNVAKTLFDWAPGFPKKIYVISHGQNLAEFKEKCPERFTCLLCKRMMYRLAEIIADLEGAEGIVTGDAIGEQASQTLRNLRVLTSAATKYPIHRPLLGFDKTETEELARKIGTFEVSIQEAKGCTAAPSKPATSADLQEVMEAEKKLDIEKMIEESYKTLRSIDLQ